MWSSMMDMAKTYQFTNEIPRTMSIELGPICTAVSFLSLTFWALHCWSAFTAGVVKIPKAQAVRLPNKTWPIIGEVENYMTAFDVYHQLHCLVGMSDIQIPRSLLNSLLRTLFDKCFIPTIIIRLTTVRLSDIVWQV